MTVLTSSHVELRTTAAPMAAFAVAGSLAHNLQHAGYRSHSTGCSETASCWFWVQLNFVKRCPKCLLDKDISEYNKSANRRDGLQVYCRSCQRGIDRAFYHANESRKEGVRGTVEAARAAAQEFVWEYLKRHPCVDCGESDPIVLDFDHVRGTKVRAVCSLVSAGFAIAVISTEIQKCEVRCANCHRRKTAQRAGNWWKDKAARRTLLA